MADLYKKTKLTIDEARLLVLGAQILLGFQYRTFLEPGFERLPVLSQHLRLGSLAAVLLTMLLLMWPGAFQQITERGEMTLKVLAFATQVMCYALFPLAVALGIDVYTVAQKVGGYPAGVTMGAAVFCGAMYFWYGLEFLRRRAGYGPPREQVMKPAEQSHQLGTPLHEKIDTVLTECRVVIPGAQALLGFQLIAVFMDAFERLPASSKYVHLASLLLIALSTILLMTPAAYHRLVERGEDTERFWRHARAMLLSAMVPLAAGVSVECFVVFAKVTGSRVLATAVASAVLAVFYALWFGFTLYKRQRFPLRGAGR